VSASQQPLWPCQAPLGLLQTRWRRLQQHCMAVVAAAVTCQLLQASGRPVWSLHSCQQLQQAVLRWCAAVKQREVSRQQQR
jgi:hypothetical protein